jgi:hypothetical protein
MDLSGPGINVKLKERKKEKMGFQMKYEFNSQGLEVD